MHAFSALVDRECGEAGSGEICGGNLCQSDKKKLGRKHLLNFRRSLVNYIVTDQVECSQRNRHTTYR